MYTLAFDGLFRQQERLAAFPGGLGVMCYGWLIFEDGVVIARGHGGYSHPAAASSNGAEYLALIEGLEALRDLGLKNEPVLVAGDARSVIAQMQGQAGVNSRRVKGLYQRARRLSRFFRSLRWAWVPRRSNQAADRLTRHALQRIRAAAALPAPRPQAAWAAGRGRQVKGFQLLSDLMIAQRPARLRL